MTLHNNRVEAALAMDPSQSFVQNFSTLLGGTATAYGAARDAFDSYVEQDMNEQIQANQGIVDLQSDRIKFESSDGSNFSTDGNYTLYGLSKA